MLLGMSGRLQIDCSREGLPDHSIPSPITQVRDAKFSCVIQRPPPTEQKQPTKASAKAPAPSSAAKKVQHQSNLNSVFVKTC